MKASKHRNLLSVSVAVVIMAWPELLPVDAWARKSDRPRYIVVDLGAVGIASRAEAINASGKIVGWADAPPDYTERHAALWPRPYRRLVDLGVLSNNFSQTAAFSINNHGQIVGTADNGEIFVQHAVFWASSHSTAVDLGTLGGDSSAAFAINSRGHIVGHAFTAQLTTNGPPYRQIIQAAYWATSESPAVGLADFGAGSQAFGINDRSQIVGIAAPADTFLVTRAVYWADSSSPATELAGLGDEFPLNFASGINARGKIIGSAASTFRDVVHAVCWPSSTSLAVDLGAPGGELINSEALGINDRGQIVGDAWNDDADLYHAVLWPNSHSPAIDLNTLIPADSGWVLEAATAINNAGEIVGEGIIDDDVRAFVLIPMSGRGR